MQLGQAADHHQHEVPVPHRSTHPGCCGRCWSLPCKHTDQRYSQTLHQERKINMSGGMCPLSRTADRCQGQKPTHLLSGLEKYCDSPKETRKYYRSMEYQQASSYKASKYCKVGQSLPPPFLFLCLYRLSSRLIILMAACPPPPPPHFLPTLSSFLSLKTLLIHGLNEKFCWHEETG